MGATDTAGLRPGGRYPFSLVFARWAVVLFLLIPRVTPADLIYLGKELGELDVCGCAGKQIGGLSRLSRYFALNPLSESDVVVSTGRVFFPFEKIPASEEKLRTRAADLIASVYRKVGVRALVPGPEDFAGGPALLSRLISAVGTTALLSNGCQIPEFKSASSVEIQAGGLQIGFAGVSRQSGCSQDSAQVRDHLKQILAGWSEKKIDRKILISQWPQELTQEISAGFDWVLLSGSDYLDEPLHVPPQWYFESRSRGLTVGRIPFSGEVSQARLVELAPSLGEDVAIQRQIAEVRKVTTEKAKSVVESVEKGHPKGFIANAQKCAACHAAEYGVWRQTQHSAAILVLYAKDQHFDPECIQCHSLGYKEPGGFRSIADTLLLTGAPKRKKGEEPEIQRVLRGVFEKDSGAGPLDSRVDPKRFATLKDRYHQSIEALGTKPGIDKLYIGVQCEHCHGSREVHLTQSPADRAKQRSSITAKTCVVCHDSQHDPGFNFNAKLPKVSCKLLKQATHLK